MGQLDPLIASALGRSPYDDEIIEPPTWSQSRGVVRDGQQYDARGHPINPQTRQWTKDNIRASNEVMQAAGIIEDINDVRIRESKQARKLNEENEIGLKRLEIGRIVFIAGVWGVCGLRRRILLYQSCDVPLIDLLGQQYKSRPLLSLYGAGLPVLGACQVLAWTSHFMRALVSGPYQNQEAEHKWTPKSIAIATAEFGFAIIPLQLRIFNTLQQLGLIPAMRLMPPLRSLTPFSQFSPIQWPAFTGIEPFSRVMFLSTIAPLALTLGYVKLRNEIVAWLFAPIYSLIPRPVNLNLPSASVAPLVATPEDEGIELADNQPTPLRRQNTMDSTTGPIDEEVEPRIGFEFEETTDIGPLPPGQADASASWSAELRSADPVPVVYNITALSALPALLAADGISLVLAELAVLPLEAAMVRVLATGYQRSAGAATASMWPMLQFSWNGVANVLAIHTIEMVLLTGVWAGFNTWSEWMGGATNYEDQ